MPDLSIFRSPAPYHILSYGTLLGTQVFQSFIAGTTAYRVLPRPQFSTLQTALFPIYFSMQTALPVILALTFPGSSSPTHISSTTSTTSWGTHTTNPSGFSGVFDPSNRLHVLTPLAVMFVTSLINMALVGPATTKTMRERKHQETRDGKKSYEAPPHSKEMQALNKRFGQMHGTSSLLNMAGCLATVWYGFYLAERLV